MSTKQSTDSVYNLPRGERRKRALALYAARLKQLGITPREKENPRLNDHGGEVLDPRPLTVPAFLEPVGQRIDRLTRLGQARIDGLYDLEDEPDSEDFGNVDLVDDVQPISPYEVAGGDFDHIVKRPRKPAKASKASSATPLPEGALEASQSTEKPPLEPTKSAS